MVTVAQQQAEKIGILDHTCIFNKFGVCIVGVDTSVGCPMNCSSYRPNKRTKIKNHAINWKYTVCWVVFVGSIISLLEVIKCL